MARNNNLLNADQLRLLSHDLNNHWIAIHWATHILRDNGLTQADKQVYQEMLSRNIAAVHALLPRLLLCFEPSQRPAQLFSSLTASLNQPYSYATGSSFAALESLIEELKHLIKKSLGQ